MVVTEWPPTLCAGKRQLWIGLPSRQTVQAPQSPASHPFFTPNHPNSRRNVRKHSPGLGAASNTFPLTVKVMGLPSQSATDVPFSIESLTSRIPHLCLLLYKKLIARLKFDT